MKYITLHSLLLFLIVNEATAQLAAERVGYYGDLGRGISSSYHRGNIRKMFEKAEIDTTDYHLVYFIGNEKLKYATEHSDILTVTMVMEEDRIVSIEKRKIKTDQIKESPKVYVVFYFQTEDRKKSTYHFYRYG